MEPPIPTTPEEDVDDLIFSGQNPPRPSQRRG